MYDEDAYPTSLKALGFKNDKEKSPEGYYEVSIKAVDGCSVESCYELLAEPLGPQLKDGNLELHSNGTKVGHWR